MKSGYIYYINLGNVKTILFEILVFECMSHHNILWVDIHVYTSIQVELLCLKFIESSHTFNKFSPDTIIQFKL